MTFIFDTSSLVSLARYYLPFDQQGKIYNHMKKAMESKRIILIDAVFDECRYVAKKIVPERLDFLSDKSFMKKNKLPVITEEIIPAAPAKFYNMVENNFTTLAKNTLSETEFEKRKQEYLNSADARMIILAYNENYGDLASDWVIVTEETGEANDKKEFKKIPDICKQLNIRTMNLPEYLSAFEDLNIFFG